MEVWIKIELIGTNVFGGTETVWVKPKDIYNKDLVEVFNSRSEYYCPTVEIGRRIERR